MKLLSRSEFADIHLFEEGDKRVVKRYLAIGIRTITLSDTIGFKSPAISWNLRILKIFIILWGSISCPPSLTC